MSIISNLEFGRFVFDFTLLITLQYLDGYAFCQKFSRSGGVCVFGFIRAICGSVYLRAGSVIVSFSLCDHVGSPCSVPYFYLSLQAAESSIGHGFHIGT